MKWIHKLLPLLMVMLLIVSAMPVTAEEAAAPTQTITLRNGDVSSEVARLQVRLKELGYYAGEADGKYGTSTENAVRAFQKEHGLAVDGKAGVRTQQLLYSSPTAAPTAAPTPVSETLKNGDEGADIVRLQERLRELGYYTGSADGKYGTSTENAVRTFQKAHKLAVDGKAGKQTQNMIYSDKALPVHTTPTPVPTPVPTPETLQNGDEGPSVTLLQSRLLELGYYKGTADGKYGNSTENAVRAFQKAHKLVVDGKAGNHTRSLIFSKEALPYGVTPTPRPSASVTPTPDPKATATPAPTESYRSETWTRYLSLRSTGHDVTQLQNRLIELGWLYGKADGVFGAATETAIIAFQRANKTWADGVVGPRTDVALYYVAEPLTAAEPVACLGVAMNVGDTGIAVTLVQKRLKTLKYYDGPITGVYDTETMGAVKLFQSRCGQRATGIGSNQLYNALFATTAVMYDVLITVTKNP